MLSTKYATVSSIRFPRSITSCHYSWDWTAVYFQRRSGPRNSCWNGCGQTIGNDTTGGWLCGQPRRTTFQNDGLQAHRISYLLFYGRPYFFDFCNNPPAPESVCGIHVLNEGNSCCNNQPTYPAHLNISLIDSLLYWPRVWNWLEMGWISINCWILV